MTETLDNFHSYIEKHEDYITKISPTALIVNEYVAGRVAYELYTADYFPSIELQRIPKKGMALSIPNWKENFTNSVLCNAGWYLPSCKVPLVALSGFTDINSNYSDFIFEDQSLGYSASAIGGFEVKGFHFSWIISLLLQDNDRYSLANTAIIRSDNTQSYTTVRYDFDEAFSFLYKCDNKRLLKQKDIRKMYPSSSVDMMFYLGNAQLLLTPTSLAEAFIPDGYYQGRTPVDLEENYQNHLKLANRLQKFPLETEFSKISDVPIEKINNIIQESYTDVANIISNKEIKRAYNIKSIIKTAKNPLGWLKKCYTAQTGEEFTIVPLADVVKNNKVQQFCSAFEGSSKNVIDMISHIVQCATTFMYVQTLQVGGCYVLAKALGEHRKILSDTDKSFLEKLEQDYKCNSIQLLNGDLCGFHEQDEMNTEIVTCLYDSKKATICELISQINEFAENEQDLINLDFCQTINIHTDL